MQYIFRMKTLFTYALLIVGFFIVSTLIQILAFSAMYESILDKGTIENSNGIVLEISKIKATNVNGFINLDVINNSDNTIKGKYIKVDLINKQDLLAATKYIKLNDINSKESYNYKITFKANNIESYKLSVVDEAPDTSSNIINIFGIEVDMDNLVMSAKNGLSKVPDFVYALVGIYITIRSGKMLWMLYLLI